MSELVRMIDEWRDAHGQPSDSSISRAISSNGSTKTLSAWRNRGIKSFPEKETLQKLAVFLNVPLETVVTAAARDAGYLPAERAPEPPPPERATGT